MMPKAIQMPVLGPVMGRAEKALLCFEPKRRKNPRKSASTDQGRDRSSTNQKGTESPAIQFGLFSSSGGRSVERHLSVYMVKQLLVVGEKDFGGGAGFHSL